MVIRRVSGGKLTNRFRAFYFYIHSHVHKSALREKEVENNISEMHRIAKTDKRCPEERLPATHIDFLKDIGKVMSQITTLRPQ